MSEPNTENERLAARLSSIAVALQPPAQANGGHVIAHSLSEGVVKALAKGLVPFLKTFVAEALAPLVARNAVCEQRIAELEAQLAECLKDGGTWRAEKLFRPGEVVTYRGVPWVCNEANTNVRPGGSDAWRLMAKSKGHRWGTTSDPEM